MLVLLLVLLIGVYFIYDTAYVYYHAAAARVTYQRPGTAEETGPSAKSLTEDYVAWLTLDDNEIDTPVMQGEDNSKYLNTDPYGDYSLAGSIFLDSRNTSDFSDSYNLTYGHHMSNHLMFGALDRFYDERYFEQHSSGTLRVGELVYPLQIFGGRPCCAPWENRIKRENLNHEKNISNHRLHPCDPAAGGIDRNGPRGVQLRDGRSPDPRGRYGLFSPKVGRRGG